MSPLPSVYCPSLLSCPPVEEDRDGPEEDQRDNPADTENSLVRPAPSSRVTTSNTHITGGVIMDVVNAEEAKIAERAGACAVMALER